MNSNIIFLCIISIFTDNIQKSVLIKNPEIRYNVFYKNTKHLHDAVNKLFTALKLSRTFKETAKIKLLITMHGNLIKIIEKNHKLTETQNTTDKIPIKDLDKVHERIVELLEGMAIFDNNNNSSDYFNILGNEISIENIAKEIMRCLKHSLSKTPNIRTRNLNLIESKGRKNLTPNFKAWVPHDNEIALNRRIYKSKKTEIKKYPFMVSVHVISEFVCAGSIINRDLVITAASCLRGIFRNQHHVINPSNVIVRVGSDFTTYNGELIPIIEIFFHPDYDTNSLKNNLAILKMDVTMRVTKKKRRIRRLMYDNLGHKLPQSVMMLGWGARNEANEPFEFQKLSFAYLDIYELENCKEVYSRFYVTENNFCAGFINKGSGACMNDIGDPTIVDGVLVGLVSYGPPLCGTPDAPTVFTKISHYSAWIDSIIKLSPVKSTATHQVLRMPQSTLAYIRFKSTTQKSPHTIVHPQIKYNNYPEEVLILREILKDLDVSANAIIYDIIDEGFNEEIFESTTKIDILHHPLVNKSVFEISSKPAFYKHTPIHTISLTTSTNTAATTPMEDHIPLPDYFEDYEEFLSMFDHLYTLTVVEHFTDSTHQISRTPPSTDFTKYFTDGYARDRNTFPKQDSADNSIEASENYEESFEGLSIEKTTAKIYDEPTTFSSNIKGHNIMNHEIYKDSIINIKKSMPYRYPPNHVK